MMVQACGLVLGIVTALGSVAGAQAVGAAPVDAAPAGTVLTQAKVFPWESMPSRRLTVGSENCITALAVEERKVHRPSRPSAPENITLAGMRTKYMAVLLCSFQMGVDFRWVAWEKTTISQKERYDSRQADFVEGK